MKNWKIIIVFIVVIYLYYNLFSSIKRGEIVWNIFKYSRREKPFVFWLTCFCQFTLATLFLSIAVLYTFYYEQLASFLARIS